MSEILTVKETAKLLKFHESTIYRRLESGAWPFAWKMGKDWRIEEDALLAHLRRPSSNPATRFRQRLREEG